MTIKPLADRVVLKATEIEETTKSGFIITSASQEKPQFSEVVAVGPDGVLNGNEVKKLSDDQLIKQYGELTNQTFMKKDGSNYIFKDEAGKEESFTPDEVIDAIASNACVTASIPEAAVSPLGADI